MSKPDQIGNEKLRSSLSKLRGMRFHRAEELAEFLKKENIHFSADDLLSYGYILAPRLDRFEALLSVPPWLASVFSSLAEGVEAATICDPWAGAGVLLAVLRDTIRPKRAIAFTSNQGEQTLGKVLVPEADWQLGDPLLLLSEANEEFDLTASVLPLGARTVSPVNVALPSGYTIDLHDDLGNLLLVAASLRLNASGIGLFVVTPSFFSSSRSVFRQFRNLGLGVQAAFALPSGTFVPYTNISSYLVVVRRMVLDGMFVAQLSRDVDANRDIIENFRQNMGSGPVDMGRFVVAQSFRGLEALRLEERLAIAELEHGRPAIKLEEIATEINMGRFDDNFVFRPEENALFVPLIGNSDAVESLDDLTLKKQNYAQIVIDPARSNARFVAHFLNSQFGKDSREQSKSGFIPRLNKQALKELRVFVPDLQTQRRTLEVEAGIVAEHSIVLALENEIAELRRELWGNPFSSGNVEQRLSGLATRLAGGVKQHASEGLDQWLESLPFPLASILRAWQATPTEDFKMKHEHLLHFFEATAEFLAVILLSAFNSNNEVFELHKHKIIEVMKKQNLSFRWATFGTWKLVVEYFGKQTRELLSENGKKPEDSTNDRRLCAELFCDPSLTLPQGLSGKEVADILSTTNKMRNDWSGHGGVVGQEEANLRNERLLAELQRLRQAIAGTWDHTQLIHALSSRLRGGVFENEVAIMVGSNSEFLKELRKMSMCLDVERLYIAKKDSFRALELLPLVRVGPSPQSAINACYFFSRLEQGGARFVSYHFTGLPEWTSQSDAATETIRLLTQEP